MSHSPAPDVPGHALLEGRTVLITAAAGAGIGFAAAKRCVEEGARVLADYLVEARKADRKLILTSASKGGGDIAHALGNLLAGEDLKHVRGWGSIGGVLRGTPLADVGLTFPSSWLLALTGWAHGTSLGVARDLSTATGDFNQGIVIEDAEVSSTGTGTGASGESSSMPWPCSWRQSAIGRCSWPSTSTATSTSSSRPISFSRPTRR